MFYISDTTILNRFDGLSVPHIQHALNTDKSKTVKYDYFGPHVSRGSVHGLHTKYGVLSLKFAERNGAFTHLEVLK